MRFNDPLFLFLLLLLPVLWLVLRRRERLGRATIRFPDITHLKQAPKSWMVRGRHLTKILRLLVLGLLIVALARPQQGRSKRQVQAEGIAIALVIDCSESMSIQDFRPNRLEAAKQVIQKFVDGREHDEICAVIYGLSSLVACPMTLDYGVLKDFVARLNFRDLGERFIGRTAIGLGLAQGLNQLAKSEAESKVVILLTDGRNNAGDEMPPLKAAELARTLGVRVYTIGMGKPRKPPPSFGFFPMMREPALDEVLLSEIANKTGGKYFRADNEKKLKAIYEEIDQLEKKKFDVPEYDSYDEKMGGWVALALLSLLSEIGLGYTRFMKLP